MSESDDPQMSFRLNDEAERGNFNDALGKQKHIPSRAKFFLSVMEAVQRASDDGELIEWPVELVTKKRK